MDVSLEEMLAAVVEKALAPLAARISRLESSVTPSPAEVCTHSIITSEAALRDAISLMSSRLHDVSVSIDEQQGQLDERLDALSSVVSRFAKGTVRAPRSVFDTCGLTNYDFILCAGAWQYWGGRGRPSRGAHSPP